MAADAVFFVLFPSFLGSYLGGDYLRRKLIPKVSFDIGHSKRDIVYRTAVLKLFGWFIGPILAGSVMLQLWVNFWT